MEEEIRIEIPGEPVPWARARKHGKVHFTPAHVRAWQADASVLSRIAMKGRKPFEGGVRLSLVAVFPVPKSWSKKKRQAALDGLVQHISRPDLDNLIKCFKDCANQVIYRDDSQVCRVDATKLYGEKPGVYVVVKPIEEVKG